MPLCSRLGRNPKIFCSTWNLPGLRLFKDSQGLVTVGLSLKERLGDETDRGYLFNLTALAVTQPPRGQSPNHSQMLSNAAGCDLSHSALPCSPLVLARVGPDESGSLAQRHSLKSERST